MAAPNVIEGPTLFPDPGGSVPSDCCARYRYEPVNDHIKVRHRPPKISFSWTRSPVSPTWAGKAEVALASGTQTSMPVWNENGC
jgi:hypothetical protein